MRIDGDFEDREGHQAPFTLPEGKGGIDGVEVGPLVGGQFRMEQFAIGGDFEGAAAGWNQGERGDAIGELKDLSRQTDGFWRVVSDYAVFDSYFGLQKEAPFRVEASGDDWRVKLQPLRSAERSREWGLTGRVLNAHGRVAQRATSTRGGGLSRDGVGGALAGVGVEHALAQAEGLRSHFHVFIRSDVLDRTLQGHL